MGFVAFRGFYGAFLWERGRGYAHPYLFWFVVLAVLPNQILRKKIYAKSRVLHPNGDLVLYIKRTCDIGYRCQMALKRLPKNGKGRQKPFVKIDNAKVAEALQILPKVN